MALRAVRNDEPVDGLASREAWAQQTGEALMTVSTLQRTVLELAYFKSMTQPEIARQLGIPLPMVQVTAAGGLVRLGRAIEAACWAAPPAL